MYNMFSGYSATSLSKTELLKIAHGFTNWKPLFQPGAVAQNPYSQLLRILRQENPLKPGGVQGHPGQDSKTSLKKGEGAYSWIKREIILEILKHSEWGASQYSSVVEYLPSMYKAWVWSIARVSGEFT